MGKFSHRFVAAIVGNIGKLKFSRKKLLLSIVSLVLATVVLISSTVCWYMLMTANGEVSDTNLDIDNGLRINDLGESFKDIAEDSFIRPASSVDGRNIYFPADGESFSNQTANMIFRNANAGDKNDGYIQYDFDLTAEENYTSIYLDTLTDEGADAPNTYVYFEGWNDDDKAQDNDFEDAEEAKKYSNALRAAIYYEGMDDNKPIVFSPQKATRTTNAVKEIDSNDGSFLAVGTQTAYPFKNYSYGKRQLAIMDKGERRRFSLIIWLEGTDKFCEDKLAGRKIELSIKFTTSWENTDKIQFVDTHNHLIKNLLRDNQNYALALFYDDAHHGITNYRFNMYTDVAATITDDNDQNYPRDVWYCNIPGTAASELRFRIINLSTFNSSNPDASTIYKWEFSDSAHTKDTLNRVDSTVYINDSSSLSSSIYGHWHDGDIEDYGGGHDIGDIDDGDW